MATDDSTSTIRMIAPHGPDARTSYMEIVCRSLAVRTLLPLGPDVRKPDMEITCSGRASVQTIEPSRPDDVLIQERFLRGNSGNILSHSCPSGRPWSSVRTAPRQILPDAHSDPQTINSGPWALRLQEFGVNSSRAQRRDISSEVVLSSVLRYKLKSILEVGSKIRSSIEDPSGRRTWLGSVRVGLHVRDQGMTTASVHVSVTILYLA
jgi:hypothetical protein